MELLLEWNEKINLTAITNPEDIILKHLQTPMHPVQKQKNADLWLPIVFTLNRRLFHLIRKTR